MSRTYHKILKICIGEILIQTGFQKTTESGITCATDVLQHFLEQVITNIETVDSEISLKHLWQKYSSNELVEFMRMQNEGSGDMLTTLKILPKNYEWSCKETTNASISGDRNVENIRPSINENCHEILEAILKEKIFLSTITKETTENLIKKAQRMFNLRKDSPLDTENDLKGTEILNLNEETKPDFESKLMLSGPCSSYPITAYVEVPHNNNNAAESKSKPQTVFELEQHKQFQCLENPEVSDDQNNFLDSQSNHSSENQKINSLNQSLDGRVGHPFNSKEETDLNTDSEHASNILNSSFKGQNYSIELTHRALNDKNNYILQSQKMENGNDGLLGSTWSKTNAVAIRGETTNNGPVSSEHTNNDDIKAKLDYNNEEDIQIEIPKNSKIITESGKIADNYPHFNELKSKISFNYKNSNENVEIFQKYVENNRDQTVFEILEGILNSCGNVLRSDVYENINDILTIPYATLLRVFRILHGPITNNTSNSQFLNISTQLFLYVQYNMFLIHKKLLDYEKKSPETSGDDSSLNDHFDFFDCRNHSNTVIFDSKRVESKDKNITPSINDQKYNSSSENIKNNSGNILDANSTNFGILCKNVCINGESGENSKVKEKSGDNFAELRKSGENLKMKEKSGDNFAELRKSGENSILNEGSSQNLFIREEFDENIRNFTKSGRDLLELPKMSQNSLKTPKPDDNMSEFTKSSKNLPVTPKQDKNMCGFKESKKNLSKPLKPSESQQIVQKHQFSGHLNGKITDKKPHLPLKNRQNLKDPLLYTQSADDFFNVISKNQRKTNFPNYASDDMHIPEISFKSIFLGDSIFNAHFHKSSVASPLLKRCFNNSRYKFNKKFKPFHGNKLEHNADKNFESFINSLKKNMLCNSNKSENGLQNNSKKKIRESKIDDINSVNSTKHENLELPVDVDNEINSFTAAFHQYIDYIYDDIHSNLDSLDNITLINEICQHLLPYDTKRNLTELTAIPVKIHDKLVELIPNAQNIGAFRRKSKGVEYTQQDEAINVYTGTFDTHLIDELFLTDESDSF